ncbi:MAG: diguanylate cyclase [Deltaproteobacteria bacterium]|nr:diguanylate cyclase [Deltaproteobacteria bacterium]
MNQKNLLKYQLSLMGVILVAGLAASFNTEMRKEFFTVFVLFWLVLLSLYGFLFYQFLSFVRQSRKREEMLVQMGARDLVTGLMNRRVFEAIAGQEIERARRKEYPASLIFMRVEPIDPATKDFPQMAVRHLLFQIAEFLRKTCRNYDGIFAYDRETFVVLLSEVNADQLSMIAQRIEKKLAQKEFFIGLSNSAVKPRVNYGLSNFPAHGDDLKGIVQYGLKSVVGESGMMHRAKP